MLRELLLGALDMLIPPRRTERVVRTLALADLEECRSPLLRQGYAGLDYQDPRVKALVWELKYHANSRAAKLAGALLAEELVAAASEELGRPLLLPVPMHAQRLRERGHNQTELLCEAALSTLRATAKAEPVEYAPTLLVRTKNTPTQQGLERSVRLKNVRGSMRAADPKRVAQRVCLVVDDVTTTGATLEEARRALTAAGARKVVCIALAQS